MLLRLRNYKDVDERKLMDIYSESNYENTDYFYPVEIDKTAAVKNVEAGFMDFLKNKFYSYQRFAIGSLRKTAYG